MFAVFHQGMSGADVLDRLDQGYRMPKPSADSYVCPDALYETMLKCWSRNAEERPTFVFLRDFFDDFLVASEDSYKESGHF